uniref:Xyloglucanase n=1 Tax=uncultured bacterium contig00214 TaxID=1181611 RepID=A0A806KI44_9BACT|nr:xyloglucanase [uncultured bacterium contig00214]
MGIWQSADEAKSWTRIDDEKHAFGALANGNFVRGDMNTFGVVYRSTAGRGIAARMPAEWEATMPSSSSIAPSSSSEEMPSSSSEASTPILSSPQSLVPSPNAPRYYNLKGEPLGTAKPSKPGVYIEKNGKNVRKIVVR